MSQERLKVRDVDEAKDLVAGTVKKVEILPLQPPADLESCIVRSIVALGEGNGPACWLDACYVCGSSGAADTLLFCVDCGEAFHNFCVGAPVSSMDEAAAAGWRCSNCKVCELSGRSPEIDTDLLYCEGCDRSYNMKEMHPPLLKPPDSRWLCGLCVECDACGRKCKKTEWSCDQNLCFRCGGGKKARNCVYR